MPLDATYKTRSLILLENPHSLSYQARTFTILPPIAFVEGASNIEECSLPLKSIDTHSSSEYSSIPFRGPSAAFLKAMFPCSAVGSFSRAQTRSTRETVGTGTLTARPASFPLREGRTRTIAFAAPVVVGIIERAAARALLKSLCGRSRH